jgi:hypothetical protein
MPVIVPPEIVTVVKVPPLETVAPEKLIVLPVDTVRLVNVAAAGVVAPITVLSIVPALISVSATRESILAVPSIYRSLNSAPTAPRSIYLLQEQ